MLDYWGVQLPKVQLEVHFILKVLKNSKAFCMKTIL